MSDPSAPSRSQREHEALEALRVSERAYRTLVETSHDLIWSVDAQGRWTFVNAAAHAIYGYEPAEMLGRPFMDFQTLEQAEKDLEVFARIKAGAPHFKYETEHLRKDGTPVWLSFNAVVLRDNQGTVLGTTGTAQNITERKRVEHALRESEDRFRRLIEYAPEAVVLLDMATGTYAHVNPAAEQLFKLPAAELCRTGLVQMSPPVQPDGRPSEEKARELLVRTLAGETPVFEWTHCDAEGHDIPCEVRLLRLEIGGREVVRGSVTDITERKRTEYALQERERELRLITNSLPGPISRVDRNLRYLFVNDEYERVFGKPRSSVVGHAMPEVIGEKLFQQIQPHVRRVLDGESVTLETQTPAAGDGVVHWLVTFIPDRDPDRHVIGFFVIALEITARKQSEEALQREQSLFSSLIQTIPDHVYFKDRQSRFVRINDSMAQGFGLRTPEEAIGRTDFDFFGEEHARLAYADEQRVMSTGESVVGIEEKESWPDGRITWVSTTKVALRDAHGQISGLVGISRDVTERKNFQLARDRSLSLVRATLESTADGILVVNVEGKIEIFNRVFARMWGVSEDDLASQGDSRALQPVLDQLSVPAEFLEKIAYLLAHPMEESFDTLAFKDGRVFECFSRAQLVGGEVVGRVWSFRDITARKRAEDEMRWQTAFFEAQVDSALDGILVVDRDGKKILQNRRMNELWKIPRAIAENSDDAEQLRFVASQTRDPPKFAARVAELYAHPDEVSRDEIELVDGTILERFSSPVRDKSGKHYGRIWTFRDITERRNLEEQLRQSQKMESVGQLAGGVAHDFNNILTVIHGHVTFLELPDNPPEVTRESILEIKQAADRAANLTRQLLTFSRRQAMHLHSVDLNGVVTNMARLLQRLLGEDISLELRLSAPGVVTSVDAGMIEQVLLNLAVNSRDAMPRGGRLLIETSTVDFDDAITARMPAARAGAFVCLTTSDTGTGIPAEVLPRIFEPFYTTKEQGKGTGLGLATAYGIVQQHNGWIVVESEPGHGATFRVYLPRLARAAVVPPPALAPSIARGRGETILLVEDERAVRSLVTNLLGRFNYRVVAAASGPQALELWREHRGEIRLMLTDIVMPDGMSGFELGAQLTRDAPGLQIIYTSGYSPELAGRGEELIPGVNFVAKPFEVDALLHTIRQALDRLGA